MRMLTDSVRFRGNIQNVEMLREIYFRGEAG